MRRHGFTLVEILVSIGIFVVAATLMLGALFGATEVFRRGEAARQAGDEATAVLAALQEDLSRATPVRLREGKPAPEWGRIVARVGAAGNCSLSLVTENPDRSQIRWVGSTLVGVRQQVEWDVDDKGTVDDATDDELLRTVTELGDNGQPAAGVTPKTDVVTRGCLHFGVWIEVAQAHRLVSAGPSMDWESTADPVLPFGGQAFDTNVLETRAPPDFYPLPDAMRVSLVLTGGGRFATRGRLVNDSGSGQLRISGIKALPTTSGSLLRVGNEWIRYNDFRGGVLSGVVGAQLRSAAGHAQGDLVLAGQPFSLVVALPK